MNLDDQFDKIIKQKINEAEFPFDENNWQKASKMIDAERGAAIGAKSGKMFLLIGTLFLGVAAGTFFFLYMNSGGLISSQVSQHVSVQVQSANVQGADKNEVVQAVETTNTASESHADQERTPAQGANASTSNYPAMTADNNESANNDHASVSQNNNTVENASSLNASEATSSVKGAESKPSSTKASSSSPATEKVIKMNKASHAPMKKREVLYAKNTEATNTSVLHQASTRSANDEILNATRSKESEGYDYLQMHSSLLQIWKKDEVLKSSAHDFIRIYDEDYYKRSRRKTHYMNIEVGAAYHLGWQTENGNDGSGFSPFAGINYGLYIGPRLNISLGAQYYSVDHIKNPYYKRQSFAYDFGYNGSHTEIANTSLYYLGVPLKVSRTISRFGKIGMGVNVGFLFSGKNSVTTYSERDLVKSDLQTIKGKGYYEGMNTTNIMASAFYNHRLNQRISLNGEVMLGFSDLYNKSATLNSTRENLFGFRMSVQFMLFDK